MFRTLSPEIELGNEKKKREKGPGPPSIRNCPFSSSTSIHRQHIIRRTYLPVSRVLLVVSGEHNTTAAWSRARIEMIANRKRTARRIHAWRTRTWRTRTEQLIARRARTSPAGTRFVSGERDFCARARLWSTGPYVRATGQNRFRRG